MFATQANPSAARNSGSPAPMHDLPPAGHTLDLLDQPHLVEVIGVVEDGEPLGDDDAVVPGEGDVGDTLTSSAHADQLALDLHNTLHEHKPRLCSGAEVTRLKVGEFSGQAGDVRVGVGRGGSPWGAREGLLPSTLNVTHQGLSVKKIV